MCSTRCAEVVLRISEPPPFTRKGYWVVTTAYAYNHLGDRCHNIARGGLAPPLPASCTLPTIFCIIMRNDVLAKKQQKRLIAWLSRTGKAHLPNSATIARVGCVFSAGPSVVLGCPLRQKRQFWTCDRITIL